MTVNEETTAMLVGHLCTATTVLVLPAAYLFYQFYKFRTAHVLRVRNWTLVGVVNGGVAIAAMILISAFAAPETIGSSCEWVLYKMIFYVVIINVFVIKIWILFFNYIATMEAVDNFDRQVENEATAAASMEDIDSAMRLDDSEKWLHARQLMFLHPRISILIGTFYLLLQFGSLAIVPILYADLYFVPQTLLTDCVDLLKWEYCIFAVFEILQVGLSTWIIKRLWSIEENFGLKKEIVAAAVTTLLLVLFKISLFLHPFSENLLYFSEALAYFAIIACWAMFYIPIQLCIRALIKPKLRSDYTKTVDRVSRSSDPNGNISGPFVELLNDSDGVEIYQKFLRAELSVENLLFYETTVEYFNLIVRAEQIGEDIPAEELINMGKTIFETYLDNGAVMMVNISHRMKVQIENVLTNPAVDKMPEPFIDSLVESLEAAQREIFNLMLYDSFMRFKMTEQYLQWKEEMDESERRLSRASVRSRVSPVGSRV